jgi:predicted DNA-binding transcriptional regulator AlpA
MTSPASPRPGRPHAAPEDRLLSAGQVAYLLGGNITAATVIRCYRKWDLLPARRIGRELRWKQSDVNDWINRQPG